METKIIIGGFGGQGILFFGTTLAYTAMVEGKEVTWFPSYGAEVRGGTANCSVIISDDSIGSPIVTNPDILIVMNEASLNKFLPRLKQKGFLLYDSSLIKTSIPRSDIDCFGVPATDISSKIGNTKSANMVLLGALMKKTGVLNESSVFEAIKHSMSHKKQKTIELNKKAILKGIQYLENKKSKNS